VTKRLVQVRFVGSGDAFGSGGRFQACILLRAPGQDGDVLLDCGASSLIALKQQRQDPNQIGLVVVSHLHGDHFGGLPFLILDGQFAHRPLHVAGPAGVGVRVEAAMEVLFPGSTGVRRRFPVQFHELTDRRPLRFDLGPAGLVVVPFAVVHASGAPALGMRVAWQGQTIAYTGDTEWTQALVELADGPSC
jgi:ribonuclease BN (tRNA processing enzyme)